jgi:hypothetical protein
LGRFPTYPHISRPGPAATAAQLTGGLFRFLFFRCQMGPASQPHLFPRCTFFLPAVGACSPGRARTHAPDGTAACPAGPNAESLRARAWVGTSRDGDFTHFPQHRAPLRIGLCRAQTGGRLGLSPRATRRRASKSRGDQIPAAQATNPNGVFDSLSSV